MKEKPYLSESRGLSLSTGSKKGALRPLGFSRVRTILLMIAWRLLSVVLLIEENLQFLAVLRIRSNVYDILEIKTNLQEHQTLSMPPSSM